MEVFVTRILHNFGKDNINCRMCYSSIGIDDGTILWVLQGIGNGNVYGFAIIIVTMVGVAGVLGYGFVLGILQDFVLV